MIADGCWQLDDADDVVDVEIRHILGNAIEVIRCTEGSINTRLRQWSPPLSWLIIGLLQIIPQVAIELT